MVLCGDKKKFAEEKERKKLGKKQHKMFSNRRKTPKWSRIIIVITLVN